MTKINTQIKELASDLTNVLNSPVVPISLRFLIADAVSKEYVSPDLQENIVHNLEIQLEKEKRIK